MTGIYIHVPFCAKKCPYCDFYSCNYTLKAAGEYTAAVIRNIETLDDITADTVYFGGGTPSLLPPEYINDIVRALDNNMRLVSPEITLEVNPCTVTRDKLNEYRSIGINRLSFGVQSGNNDELSFLGRIHTFEKASEIVEQAYAVGFDNISCDIMLGIKNQTPERLENTINKITALPVQHISSYILKVENNTEFGRKHMEKNLPDDDFTADLYLHSVRCLESAGFRQYEISNFSKAGHESRHNLKYWHCEEYIGIGPSAHSYYKGKRFSVPADLEKFCGGKQQEIIYDDYVPGTDEEKIMLGLRLTDGIRLDDYPEKKDSIKAKINNYCNHGLAVIENNRLRLTPKGFLVSNSIIADMIL